MYIYGIRTIRAIVRLKYLVIKFTHFSKTVQKQQLIRAQHDVTVEQFTVQTPAHKIQSQLIAAVLS